MGASDISPQLVKLLAALEKEEHLHQLPYHTFIIRLAYYLAELNYIHPFREGNGRATREFFRLLVERNRYKVDWTAAGTFPLLDAMIESVFDSSHLCNVLRQCIISK